MTVIQLKKFSGEIPNQRPHALPDQNAQFASNCDFSNGDLRPIKGGLLLATMSMGVKSIYTEDGEDFFSWNYEAHPWRGPVIEDSFRRVYYTMDNLLMSVTTADLAVPTGGEPSAAWTVGVPAPTVAPALTIVDRTSVKDLTLAFGASAWYEVNGTRYDEAAVSLTVGTHLREYNFTPPTKSAWDEATGVGTPPEARLTCQLNFTDVTLSKVIASPLIMAGSDTPARCNAFPGGIEISLSDTGYLKLTWGVYETRAYVFTMVNTFNEESAPSPATTVDVTYIQDVRINVTQPSFTGYRPPTGVVNVYRTFGTAANYYKIAVTQESPTTQYLDLTYKASQVGATLPSLEWFVPEPEMFGLTALPNGSFAAFKDNVLYMSEPYYPHAWPYSMSFPKNIKGMRMAAQALVVTTEDGCYNVLSSHPKNMRSQLLSSPQSGISHRSMAVVDGGVAFLSNDGIVIVEGSQASLQSDAIFTRETWRAVYGDVLDDMWVGHHDGHLIGASASESTGFIIRMERGGASYSRWPQEVDALFRLQVTDSLYYATGAAVYAFRAGSALELDWWSKDFILGKPTNFGAFYIRTTGSVDVELFLDNVSWYTFTAAATGYYRLPAGKKGLCWSVRVQTSANIQEMILAEGMGELRSV
jgi:hypothetical protein